MIKVITFDLDGVYFPNGKANFKKAITAQGVSDEDFSRVFAKSPQMNLEYKLGKMSDEAFWTWASTEWKLSLDWKQLIDLLIAGYDLDERIVSVIRDARAKGYKTAICTSNFPARINGLQTKFSFLDDFDVKVISYELVTTNPIRKFSINLLSIQIHNPKRSFLLMTTQIRSKALGPLESQPSNTKTLTPISSNCEVLA